jgi:hypothetical protein
VKVSRGFGEDLGDLQRARAAARAVEKGAPSAKLPALLGRFLFEDFYGHYDEE